MLTPTVDLEPGTYTVQVRILENNDEITQRAVEIELAEPIDM